MITIQDTIGISGFILALVHIIIAIWSSKERIRVKCRMPFVFRPGSRGLPAQAKHLVKSSSLLTVDIWNVGKIPIYIEEVVIRFEPISEITRAVGNKKIIQVEDRYTLARREPTNRIEPGDKTRYETIKMSRPCGFKACLLILGNGKELYRREFRDKEF